MIDNFSAVLSRTCACGRSYDDAGGFTRHQRACPRGKKRLSSALEAAKESYRRKRVRLQQASDLGLDSEVEQSHAEDSSRSDARFSGSSNDEPVNVSSTKLLLRIKKFNSS